MAKKWNFKGERERISLANKTKAEVLALADGAVITPQQVLEFARQNPQSACYSQFDSRGLWDDATAADLARLEFAKTLISRVHLKVRHRKTEKVRVSLVKLPTSADRAREQRIAELSDRYQSRQSLWDDDSDEPEVEESIYLSGDVDAFVRDVRELERRYSSLMTNQLQDLLEGVIATAKRLSRVSA